MKRAAKYAGLGLCIVVVGLGIAFVFRTDPIAIIPGKRLSGEEQPYPADWAFSNEHMTIAVESRPGDPHSVTTICFIHEGNLYVPAQSGSTKKWPQYVLEDPRVRLKIGDAVYPARATRVTNIGPEEITPSAASKYTAFADREPGEGPQDVWLFVISQR